MGKSKKITADFLHPIDFDKFKDEDFIYFGLTKNLWCCVWRSLQNRERELKTKFDDASHSEYTDINNVFSHLLSAVGEISESGIMSGSASWQRLVIDMKCCPRCFRDEFPGGETKARPDCTECGGTGNFEVAKGG
ncbi:MAG TPA: hypothetical protein V6C76_11495 [Drouetiella sp.]